MANEAGVVKSVTGGSVRALNNITGEVRNLNVGDIVYQNEKITTDSSNSKVVITQTDGKDITLLGKDTITLDQSTSNNESFGNETVADISALQQAILNGTDLNALEETAAGGGATGGGDGVSLSATSFTEGGHISNVNAGVGNIDSILAAGARGNDLSIGQGDNANVNAAPQPQPQPQPQPEPPLPAGSIKIPLSAYKGESMSSGLLDSFASSIPNGYHVYRHTDGRDYLTPDDPTTPSAFQHKDGWYVSNDGKLAIGQDNAKDLAVTSAAKASNYPDDGSVAKIVNPNPSLKVFGSDNADKITVDGAKITSVHGGVGNDNVDLKNGAEIIGISGGSGEDKISVDNSKVTSSILGGSEDDIIKVSNNSEVKGIGGNGGSDTITVDSGSKVDTLLGDSKTKNDVHEKRVDPNLNIEDNGAAGDTIKVSGTGTQVRFIGAGNGDDDITVDKGARVGLIQADEGNDKVTVSDSGTYVSAINGRGGDDEILVEKGAKVDGIVGRWGNDKITVKDVGTVVTQNIEGNEDSDTIKILDGAKVKGYVSGGRGESPSIYGGAADSDKDNITVENSTVEGVVEGGIWGGNDGMKIKNSHIGGISGGNGENKIDISNVTNLDSKTVWGNKFKDIVNIDGMLINSEIKTIEGEDIVNINAGATIDKIDINTGADKDTVNINANITADVGKQSNIATEGGIDKVNIASGVTLTRTVISTGAGEETIKINDGKTAASDRIVFNSSELNTGADNDIVEVTNTTFKKISGTNYSSIQTGDGEDKVTIKDKTIFQDSSFIATGNGNDKVYLESGAKFDTGNVYTDAGNDEIHVNGAEFKNGGVHSGTGEDKIFINSGTFENSSIKGNQDSDEINIRGNAKIKSSHISADAGADDKINISGNAEIEGGTIQLGGYATDNGQSTDKTTLNVIENAVLKDVSIQASKSLGKQVMNFHQSGEAKITTIVGSNNKDVIDITGNFTTTNGIDAKNGDDEISIHGGATAKINLAEMGNGNDKLTVENATLGENSHINMGSGNDEVNINSSANLLADTKIYTDDGNDTVNIRGGTFSEAEIRLGKGKNEVNIESGAVFGDQDAGLNGFGEHKTYIRSDHRASQISEDTINVKAGATVKNAEIQTYGGKDTLNVDGSIKNSNVNTGEGDDDIYLNSGAILNDVRISTSDGSDTINIKTSMTGSDYRRGLENPKSYIYTGDIGNDGHINDDMVNIINERENHQDIILKNVKIADGENGVRNVGNDAINIVNNNMQGKNIELDRVEIDSGGADYRFGNDRVYISNQGSGKIIIKDTEIKTGEGKDTIDIAGRYPYNDENVILERTNISTGDSRDIINIEEATLKQSSLITGSKHRGSYEPDKSDNDDIYIRKSYLESSTIDAGQSENESSKRDKVDINNSKIVNSHIYGGSGEDEIYITNSNVRGSQIHMGIRDERDPDHRIDDGSRGSLWIVGGEMAGSKVYGSLLNGDDITIGRFNPSESNTNDITKISDSIIDAGGNDPFGINSRDRIRIGNAILEGTEILAKNGASTIEIDKTEIKGSYRESKIETGNDANTIDKVDITSTTIIGTDIKTNDGRDEIKIDSGSKIERSKIDTGNGNDEIAIENSRIAHTQINTGDNEDVITFRNTEIEDLRIDTMDHKDIITIENNPYYGSKTANNVMVDTGNGNDEIVIRNTNLSDSHLLTGSGNDVISLENTDFKGSNIDTGYGADILKVSGGVSLEGSSGVNLGEGDDILEINRGARTYLGGEKVDGGIGIDTLIVNEPTIDFSKVKNFEKIQLGGHAEINAAGNTTVIDDNATSLRLTTENVKGILEGSSENVLKINGGNGDALNISQDFNKTSSSPILGNDRKYYTEYTSNSDPSVKMQVEEGIYII